MWNGLAAYIKIKANILYITDSYNILPLQQDCSTSWALALDSCHLSNIALEIMSLFGEETIINSYSYNIENVRNLPHNIATYR